METPTTNTRWETCRYIHAGRTGRAPTLSKWVCLQMERERTLRTNTTRQAKRPASSKTSTAYLQANRATCFRYIRSDWLYRVEGFVHKWVTFEYATLRGVAGQSVTFLHTRAKNIDWCMCAQPRNCTHETSGLAGPARKLVEVQRGRLSSEKCCAKGTASNVEDKERYLEVHFHAQLCTGVGVSKEFLLVFVWHTQTWMSN